jgi:GntR family transcriptional repressor for pyruvate dehydrogenase complex
MDNNRGLVNQTLEELMDYIKQEKYEIGEKIPPERELALAMSVSRSTLREAIKILNYSNVLEVKQGSGTFIRSKSFSNDFSELKVLKARLMLEQTAVLEIISSTNNSNDDFLIMKELLFKRNDFLIKGYFSDYIEYDLQFHKKIVEMSNNEYIIQWYNDLSNILKSILSAKTLKTSQYKDNTELHNQLFEALITKDKHLALRLVEQNIFDNEK